MARIQRKKKQRAKKKKQPGAEGVASQEPRNDAVAKKTELFSGSVKSVKTKAYSSRQKSLTRTKAEPGKFKGYIDKGLQFLREVKVELKKVVWPSRKQTIGSTVVVLILTIIISVFLGMVDIGLSSLIRVVLK
ncbi:MAG: preprotein translocase subunit SecE [Desulfobacteraceae bacterium]|nr:preprotein translocase subunit SecE [Desulfobacteraceae bacterium]MDH3721328.1 preprotein translocase subunit SecE [Desulfobacteraceae bacterium]MDH3835790.1 preprotein translocase subunit SecE [Desulfobacteraceae bacterium]MDH3874562.1 preprotein translocase subunit SecE [Desulfobacteraceae bacterium]MDH3881064.1 preprotein translocase subunit SecE [Desulfobacteraceae bacterium]